MPADRRETPPTEIPHPGRGFHQPDHPVRTGCQPGEALPAYRLIRQLNPEIEDLNSLPPARPSSLPPSLARADRPATAPVPAGQTHLPIATASERRPTDKPRQRLQSAADRGGLLGIIRPVISRMKGTVTATGNYFIPLKDTTQITIDCSLIPVVELDDGSTVLLDFGNRLSENLKGLIRQSWTNYAFLPAEELRDDLAALQGIIRRSRNYTMFSADRPLTLTAKPEILVFPDWIIAAKKAVERRALPPGALSARRQRTAPPRRGQDLPGEKRSCRHGDRRRSRGCPHSRAPTTPPAIPDLRGLKGIALAEQLLRTLGETPVRNAEVVIFDQARDGFNLSVTADLLLRKGEKRFIIHTKRLPEQFVRILKEAGTEVILIGEKDSGQIPHRRGASGTRDPRLLRSFLLPDSGRGQSSAAYRHLFRPPGDGRRRIALSDRFRYVSRRPALFSTAAWGDVSSDTDMKDYRE